MLLASAPLGWAAMSVERISMKIEKPYAGRARITARPGNFEATIPATRNWLFILGAGWLTVGFTLFFIIFFIILIVTPSGGEDPEASGSVVTLVISLWVLASGTCWGLSILLWPIAGKERITVTDGVLIVERLIPIWRRRRAFDLRSVRDLRAYPPPPPKGWSGLFGWGDTDFWSSFSVGTVQFAYGRGTRAFGLDLDKAEGDEIVEAMRPFLPSAPMQ